MKSYANLVPHSAWNLCGGWIHFTGFGQSGVCSYDVCSAHSFFDSLFKVLPVHGAVVHLLSPLNPISKRPAHAHVITWPWWKGVVARLQAFLAGVSWRLAMGYYHMTRSSWGSWTVAMAHVAGGSHNGKAESRQPGFRAAPPPHVCWPGLAMRSAAGTAWSPDPWPLWRQEAVACQSQLSSL